MAGDTPPVAKEKSIRANAIASQAIDITLHLDPPDLILSITVFEPQSERRVRVPPDYTRELTLDLMCLPGELTVRMVSGRD